MTVDPGPGEIRIRVAAAGVNRADLAQRAGLYPPPPGASPILGLEVAGVVDAVGPDSGWSVGDAVCALLAGGGYSDTVVVSGSHALPVPSGLSMVEAAALPEAFATACSNLVGIAGLGAGGTALVHAGGSGVGTAAIQLCVEIGARCFVTVGSDAKLARCLALGAAGGVNRHTGRFVDLVKGWTGGRGVDAILDPVGGPYLADDVGSLATDGTVVIIGLMGGRPGEIDLGRLLVKRLRVIGSTLRSRSDAEKAAIIAEVRRLVWPAIEAGRIRPVIDAVFPLADVDAAHARMASDATFGKIVLSVP